MVGKVIQTRTKPGRRWSTVRTSAPHQPDQQIHAQANLLPDRRRRAPAPAFPRRRARSKTSTPYARYRPRERTGDFIKQNGEETSSTTNDEVVVGNTQPKLLQGTCSTRCVIMGWSLELCVQLHLRRRDTYNKTLSGRRSKTSTKCYNVRRTRLHGPLKNLGDLALPGHQGE